MSGSWRPRARVIGLLGALALCLAGCEDGVVDLPEQLQVPDGLVISEPGSGSSAASLTGGGATDGRSVVYVSARPGTFADATGVELRNLTADEPVLPTIPVVEGGFDPVAVPARAGDELELTIRTAGTQTVLLLTVPPDRPPLVVRTDPPKGRTDVAFAARPVVIFSEPMDPSTVTPASVQLIRDGTAVAATVGVVPESPFTARLVPDEPLEPSTSYELVVTAAVRDLQGDPLEEEVRVSFVTQPVLPYQIVYRERVPEGSGTISRIYVMNADGSGRRQLTDDRAQQAAVSPDGSRILFTTEIGGNWEVFVMDADGSGLVNLTVDPAVDRQALWSPHGTKIAFASDAGPADDPGCDSDIFLMNADGSNRVNLTKSPGAFEDAPAWSPDGTKIAFTGADPCTGLYENRKHIWVMNADGSGRVELTAEYDLDLAMDPAWSPDGTKIAFWGHDDDRRDPDPIDIYVMNADGSDLVALLNDTWADVGISPRHNVAWSPDGSWILFAMTAPPSNTLPPGISKDLFIISPDGSSLVNLTHSFGVDEYVGSSQPWIR
jgi:Tol biopolymer transport system component